MLGPNLYAKKKETTSYGGFFHVILKSNGKFVLSRVLYFQWSKRVDNPPTIEATIIYLGQTLLFGSSDQPERASG
jgi:hypothetical protein